jgi:hypothetical protein
VTRILTGQKQLLNNVSPTKLVLPDGHAVTIKPRQSFHIQRIDDVRSIEMISAQSHRHMQRCRIDLCDNLLHIVYMDHLFGIATNVKQIINNSRLIERDRAVTIGTSITKVTYTRGY